MGLTISVAHTVAHGLAYAQPDCITNHIPYT